VLNEALGAHRFERLIDCCVDFGQKRAEVFFDLPKVGEQAATCA
jgi:hypothetical protein